MLQVRGLHTYYGQSHVLQGIDLDVGCGEIVCLLGRNGAGKTTTLRSLIGLVRPSSGSIRLGAVELRGAAPFRIARLGLGYVDQDRRIFPGLTVDDNLEVARNGRPGRWDKEAVYRLFAELAAIRARPGRFLSGGEQQMLAIGRALMGNPVCLLLDEPSEGLGPLVVERLRALFGQLVQEGIGILLAEQNVRFALEVAARGYIVDKGRVRYTSSAAEFRIEEVIAKYLAV